MMHTNGGQVSDVRLDRNGSSLLDGVEPLSDEVLRANGHRWRSCPDFSGGGLMVGESATAMLTGQSRGVPVVAMVCRCGAAALVPLGGGPR